MKSTFSSLALALLIMGTTMPYSAIAQTRLGLHVTQEELNIWKQRTQSGPYKNSGDVSTNSPGDWARIIGYANSFLSNPSNERWSGQTAGTCWTWQSNPPALPGRSRGEKILAAAFYYLVTGDAKYRDAVRNELLAQVGTAGTNFSDGVRWVDSSNCVSGDAYSWEITNWLTKLLFAYDYVRSSLAASDRATLDTWFLNAGNFWAKIPAAIIKLQFPNRDQDDYTTLGSGWTPDSTQCSYAKCITHYNGWRKTDFHEAWTNRAASQIRFAGLTGIMFNNSYLKAQAKRFFKEWMRFHIFPDGTDAEFHRWEDNIPTLGWSYTSLQIGAMLNLADSFARIGDFELYNYSTSEGFGTITPAGGPKNLKKVITLFLQHANHTIMRYGTDQASRNGNPNYLIDSVDGVSGEAFEGDTYLAPANIYYQDNFIKSIYIRTASGAPTYPSTPSTGGWSPWTGEWGVFPGVLFMFGQMEGRVNPYGGATETPPPPPSPPPPSNLPVTVDSTYLGYTTAAIDDGIIDAGGGTATTWASAESTTADHWIDIVLPSSQQINRATIHWAYNPVQQKYMTSQQVSVQHWDGSSYLTAATMTYGGSDVPSSTVSFPAVTTSQLRFYQPANQGNPGYADILWITEIDYAYVSPPAPPTTLNVLTLSE